MLSPRSAYENACLTGTVFDRDVPWRSGSSNRTHSTPSTCHLSRICSTLSTTLLLRLNSRRRSVPGCAAVGQNVSERDRRGRTAHLFVQARHAVQLISPRRDVAWWGS